MDQVHDWVTIKQEFLSNKYGSLKELADAHEISYNYLRKKASKWNTTKNLSNQLVNQEAQQQAQEEHKSSTKKAKKPSKQKASKPPQELPCDPVPIDVPIEDSICNQDVPNDRNNWHKTLWDKLGRIVERSLDNPEFHYFTDDGKIKTKAVSDIASVIEKIQKGQTGEKDATSGQLTQYVEAIRLAREAQNASHEVINQEEEEQ